MNEENSNSNQRPGFNESVFLPAMEELRHLYQGFPLESQIWAREGRRRSPYRTLLLFGLSPRTKDWLLVDVCRRFFAEFPGLETFLAAERCRFQGPRGIVRAGQVSFLESAAEVMRENFRQVPQEAPTLLRIRGVGDKVAECVIGYGWGREALPVDANVCRVVVRLGGSPGEKGRPLASAVREQLKGLFNLHRPRLASWQFAMIDVHELLRLHGQVVCTAVPKCWQCPLSRCPSRHNQYTASGKPVVNAALWDEWRQLLLDPTCGNIPANQPAVGKTTGGDHEP